MEAFARIVRHVVRSELFAEVDDPSIFHVQIATGATHTSPGRRKARPYEPRIVSLPALADSFSAGLTVALAPGNSNSSTTAPATALSTSSSIASARSAASTVASRPRVSGLRGVNSVQQSWSGMMEIAKLPMFCLPP